MRVHSLWDCFPRIKEPLEQVMSVIEGVIGNSPSPVREDLEDLYHNPGKFLRPAFLILSSTAGGETHPRLAEAAASVELLHAATLIHDDIIDRAPLRRKRPTLYATKGPKQAVLTGDYLLARSLELASQAHDGRLVKGLTDGISRLCLSEIRQDFSQGDFFIDREEYFERIRGKTAELFGLSCFTGALLGGAGTEVCDDFYRSGLDFGLAFQIDDDVLDYRGNGDLMGKTPGGDIRAGIPTLPLILAVEEGNGKIGRLCRSPLYRLRCRSIRREVLSGGYADRAGRIGREYRMSCLERLEKLDFPERETFIGLVEYLSERVS